MPVLDVHQVYDNWLGNGGPQNRAVAWLGVSLAESSWNTDAVSPTGAVGLYQLEPYSWPGGIGPFSLATDPGVNSRAAVLLSGGGANFAPWDTAYRDIYATGRYAYLNWPEEGSAAWHNMGFIAAALGGVPHASTQPPAQPGIDGSLSSAIVWYRQVAASATPALAARLRAVSARTARQYTRR